MLINVKVFVGVEEEQAQIGEGPGVGIDVRWFLVRLVVFENRQDLLILERLAGEFLHQGTGDGLGVFHGLGLVLGIVAVVLREILNPKIRRPAEISKKLGITPLGTIPFVDTPGERWRQRGLRSAALVVVIAGIVGALIFIDRQVSPLDQIAQKVLRQGRL